jgi:hypothetical protein
MVFHFGRGRFSAAPKPWWRPRLSPVLQGGAFPFRCPSQAVTKGGDLTAIAAQDEEAS